jgi:UTP:GlnB (protein PII) uridylyltransferase
MSQKSFAGFCWKSAFAVSICGTVCWLGTSVPASAVPQEKNLETSAATYIAQGEDIQSIAEDLVQLLADNNYAEAENLFGRPIQDEVSPESLQNHKENFIAWHGEFQEILGTRNPEENLVVVEVKTSQKTTEVFVIFNDEREVVGVDYIQESQS